MDSISFSPEMQRLIDMIETQLHFVVRFENMTRAQAINIKSAMQAPLGLLNARFSLSTNNTHTNKHKVNKRTLTGQSEQ